MNKSISERIKQIKEAIENSLNSPFDDWETRIKLRQELDELQK